MKNFLASLALAATSALALNTAPAQAVELDVAALNQAQLQLILASVTPQDLINWKVGDTASYNVGMGFPLGTSTKSVTKDEGTAIWVTQQMSLMGQKQVIEVLINKADGKVLKMIVNGKEEAVPNDPIEIISQDYATIKVPAGTFEVIHIVAKSAQSSKIEVWANPRDIVMDGTAKQSAATQFGNMTLELTSQKRAQ